MKVLGDQKYIEKLMVNQWVSESVRFWNVKLASQLKIPGPHYKSKKNSSDYRLLGTQNDRLKPTVSTQTSVLKNMYLVLRYWQKCIRIWLFKQNDKIWLPFCQYLWTQCIFSETDFYIETVGSSRSFWVPWSL